MISDEVGNDVYNRDGKSENGKLVLLQQWLYGKVGGFEPRLAPSIIARGEAELLGISSPRFAIRVYLGPYSFANIRRRKITARQIRRTYSEETADEFQGITADKADINKNTAFSDDEKKSQIHALMQSSIRSVNWLADCLLEPPQRLVDEGFAILTCCLGRDYDEDHINAATPFVTHISIGGGLCAQAACFMVLCLLENKQIFGISEITCLASPNRNQFEIHGLKPSDMRDFLISRAELGAQFQYCLQPTTVDDIVKEVENIRFALRTYIENKLPVLVMLSASRMIGLRPMEQSPSINPPIIASSAMEFIASDPRLPLGGNINYQNSWIQDPNDTKHDNHCVVVVGCDREAEHFLINDPATFPFVKCTALQLFEARCYRNFDVSASVVNGRLNLADVTEDDLGPFAFISVTPKGILLPLMRIFGDRIQGRGGLIQAVKLALLCGRPGDLRYDPKSLNLSHIHLHLGHFAGNEIVFRSGFVSNVDPMVWAELCSYLSVNSWFWVAEINIADTTGKFTRSLWFWNASKSSLENRISSLLVAVLAQQVEEGKWLLKYQQGLHS